LVKQEHRGSDGTMALEDWSLEHAIEVYLTRCEVEGKSPNTVVAYRETLGQFLDVARQQGFADDVRKMAPEHIYAYLAWVRDRGVSDHTLHRRHREVRFLFFRLSNWVMSKRIPSSTSRT
jgi:site-specific recombinase XerD